jgi:N6-adenosine-specific RNA methylase IME4
MSTDVLTKRLSQLPAKPDKLAKWILIGKAKLAAQIKAIKGIKLLEDGIAARQAALNDTQDLAEELLYAEARLGEIIEATCPSHAGRTKVLPKGVTHKLSHYAQELNRNIDAIAKAVTRARDKGEIPVRNQVLRLIQESKPKPDTPPLPKGKYNIIYADPPWEYKASDCIAKSSCLSGIHSNHYDYMSAISLKELNVNDIADENCILFMWSTSPKLNEAILLGESWGFTYCTVGFVWDKQETNPGYYTLSQIEMCLIFRKGTIPTPRGKRDVKQFLSERRGKHSRKPSEIRRRIFDMFPKQPKIELFARKPDLLFSDEGFENWDVWGNEADSYPGSKTER